MRPPSLVLLKSEFRLVYAPLLLLVKKLEGEFPGRTIAVLLPELVKKNWWQYLLHSRWAEHVRAKLLRLGGSRLVVISIPIHIEEPEKDEAVSDEAAMSSSREVAAGAPS